MGNPIRTLFEALRYRLVIRPRCKSMLTRYVG